MRIAGRAAVAVALAVTWALASMAGAGPAQALSAQNGASAKDIEAALGRSFRTMAKIVPASRPLQCVPFARKASGIGIRGDAWTWWRSAEGRYARGRTPEAGAVLVMKKTRRLRRGHLAVVTQVLDSRTILVDQSNWLNRGRLHLNTAVLDVSRENDWSAVRVWYTPGGRFGSGTYAVHGFVYPTHPAVRGAAFETMPLPRRRPDGGRLDGRPLDGRPLADLVYASVERIEPLGEPLGELLGAGRRTAALEAPETRPWWRRGAPSRIWLHEDPERRGR